MQDLKVTLVQANQIWEDKEANFSNYLRLIEFINEPIDLVVFPEMRKKWFPYFEEHNLKKLMMHKFCSKIDYQTKFRVEILYFVLLMNFAHHQQNLQ